jgi:hypothetical protein
MPNAKGGQDPTRRQPGGSRTETRITGQSTLGSDGGSTSPSGDADDMPADDGTGRQGTVTTQGQGWAKRQRNQDDAD